METLTQGVTMRLELPKWYDLHAHFRQDALLAPLIQAHLATGCAGILAMPNTKPPVAVVHRSEESSSAWSIEGYLSMLQEAGAHAFSEVLVPLYLTHNTTPAMIEAGAASGLLRACKYYPPHGTTNSEFGAPLDHFLSNGVFEAMAANNVVLCIHGEMHGLQGPDYFDSQSNAEVLFYREQMPRLLDNAPHLKMVCEHITTAEAVSFVKQHGSQVGATVTPQHLMYTVGHLVQGLRYHLYCLPLVKFDADRAALQDAVTSPNNTQFFAGTDSAPHTTKATACGCAAGCYTGNCAPQLYAQALEEAGVDLATEQGQTVFQKFLCDNGPAFYGFASSQETFVLEKKVAPLAELETPNGPVVPLPIGLNPQHGTKPTILDWSIAVA